jgi:transposase InsO family protein
MLASGIGTSFQADLADVQSLATKRGNRGTRFLLCVIDIFTRQAWVRPMKSKTASDVRDALESIWTDREMSPQSPTKPHARITMATDKGKEFLNSTVQRWFRKHRIQHFTLQGDHKAAIVERFQRTLKDRLHRVMSARAEPYKYVDLLPAVVSVYNNSQHSSLPQRMRPVDVKKETEHLAWQHQYRQLPKKRYTRGGATDQQLQVGDTVLASISKQPFQKGYRQYWHDEQFRVAQIKQGVPNKVYVLVSLRDGIPIEGVFYREQLQKVKQQQ